MPGDFQVEYLEKILLRKYGEHWHRLPGEVVESPSIEMFKNCGYVALRDTVSGKVGVG